MRIKQAIAHTLQNKLHIHMWKVHELVNTHAYAQYMYYSWLLLTAWIMSMTVYERAHISSSILSIQLLFCFIHKKDFCGNQYFGNIVTILH